MKSFWKERNVFVTGANGFVGSWIARALVENDANVIILERDTTPKSPLRLFDLYPRLTVISGDVTNYFTLLRVFNEYEIDTCFHLAAQAIVGMAYRSPLSTFESNIKGTWNVLEAARVSNVDRVVIASSDKAYGEHAELPYKEEHSLDGLHPYDASKACADILTRTYFHTYSLPVAITRCANTYGGGDLNFSRIVPDTIRSVLHDKNPLIRSDGTPIRDYLYISDAVEGFLTLAEKLGSVKGKAFNFGTNSPISVLELVNKIIMLSGKSHLEPVITGTGKTTGEIDRQYLSSEKAERVLGWKPEYDLDRGLKETLEWYRGYFNLRS